MNFGKEKIEELCPTKLPYNSTLQHPRQRDEIIKFLIDHDVKFISQLQLDENTLFSGMTFWDSQGREIMHLSPDIGATPGSRIWGDEFINRESFKELSTTDRVRFVI
jgi:hypothetical protein